MYHFLIARFIHHKTLQCRNVLSLFFNSRSLSVSNTNQHHLTLSTLVNSCGLSPQTYLKLSKRLQTKNPNDPNAVIQLLTNHGFSHSQLSKLVKKHPFVLLSHPQNTLFPKLNFFHSIGVSTTDLPNILIKNPSFLKLSLDKTLLPRYRIIRSLVCNDKQVISALKHGSRHFYFDAMVNDYVPNIELLRQLGVPQHNISFLISNFPNVAFAKHYTFLQAVNSVKELEFDPLKSNFVLALQVIGKMNTKSWEARFKVFERCGWSRDICLLAFQKYPQCMMISEKKVMQTMKFLVKDMGVTPEDIARCPAILNRNLEKTLVPRCTVVKILKSRGLIKSGLRISSFIIITERMFLKRYVTPFQKDLPLLLDMYKVQKLD